MDLNTEEAAAKRVAIAKDALMQINAGTLSPKQGTYMFQIDNGRCQVCAVGAMVAVCCPSTREQSWQGETNVAGRMVECLKDSFPVDQLALIESAFESDAWMPIRDVACDMAIDVSCQQAAEFFDDDFDLSDRDRVIAILENIIANNGTFIPERA